MSAFHAAQARATRRPGRTLRLVDTFARRLWTTHKADAPPEMMALMATLRNRNSGPLKRGQVAPRL
jgi:hypothetical protein